MTGRNFGYVGLANISGVTFNDEDGDGTKDSGDVALAQPVRLYKNGTAVTPDNTNSSGSYSFANQQVDATYKVCVLAQIGRAQTVPAGTNGVTCSAADETGRGYEFVLGSSGKTTGIDFGSKATTTGSCFPPFGVTGYQVQLVGGAPCDKEFVLGYSDSQGGQFASLQPAPDYAQPATQVGKTYPMVEEIKWTLYDSKQITLIYNDTVIDPTTGTFSTKPENLKIMPLCLFDPRDIPGANSSSLTITSAPSAQVIPSGHTSCLIYSTQSAPVLPAQTGKYVAYVYSSIDGFRSTGG